jgi:hypothetical protein
LCVLALCFLSVSLFAEDNRQSARALLVNRPKFLRLRRIIEKESSGRCGDVDHYDWSGTGQEIPRTTPKVNSQHQQLRQQHGIFSLLMSTTKNYRLRPPIYVLYTFGNDPTWKH